jgi:hypothetical protein
LQTFPMKMISIRKVFEQDLLGTRSGNCGRPL